MLSDEQQITINWYGINSPKLQQKKKSVKRTNYIVAINPRRTSPTTKNLPNTKLILKSSLPLTIWIGNKQLPTVALSLVILAVPLKSQALTS